MFVTSFDVSSRELATYRPPGGIGQLLSTRLFVGVSRVIADSSGPEFVIQRCDLSAGQHLLIIAKDKPTMVRGLSQTAASAISSSPEPVWGYLRGDYGSSFNVEVLKNSLAKGVATVKGHSLVSRGDLRHEAEKNKLLNRGYFVLLTSSQVLGPPQSIPKFTVIPAGSRSLPLSWIARSLGGGAG